jgi:hypothetical protein
MNTTYTYPEKPTLVNVIAWMTLASGIINIFWGLAASAIAIVTIVGICCTPFTILPSILGIFEILYAAKLLSNPPQPMRPSTTLAILQIACVLIGNVFAMVVGILSLVFYNDQVVKDYFDRLNGNLPPEPVPPVSPQVPPVVPTAPTPVEEPLPSPITGEEPAAPPAPVEEPLAEEITLPAEETPVSEPEPSVPSEAPVSTDEAIITSVRRDGVPDTESEPPAAPEEPDPTSKTPEE